MCPQSVALVITERIWLPLACVVFLHVLVNPDVDGPVTVVTAANRSLTLISAYPGMPHGVEVRRGRLYRPGEVNKVRYQLVQIAAKDVFIDRSTIRLEVLIIIVLDILVNAVTPVVMLKLHKGERRIVVYVRYGGHEHFFLSP